MNFFMKKELSDTLYRIWQDCRGYIDPYDCYAVCNQLESVGIDTERFRIYGIFSDMAFVWFLLFGKYVYKSGVYYEQRGE